MSGPTSRRHSRSRIRKLLVCLSALGKPLHLPRGTLWVTGWTNLSIACKRYDSFSQWVPCPNTEMAFGADFLHFPEHGPSSCPGERPPERAGAVTVSFSSILPTALAQCQ